MPSETCGRNGATPIFRSFTELTVTPQAAGVVGTINCVYIRHSEHNGLFLTLRIPYYFYKVSFFVCAYFH